MGSRFLALLVAVIGVVALALAGIYLYRHPHSAGSGPADKVATANDNKEAAPAEPKPQAEAKPEEAKPSKPTAVPAFDVVRVEPNGEGVIAGRAEPGWAVKVEDSGGIVAETTADQEGAWSVVLDKPLVPGDHALSLRAVSPDGSRALTSQQSVQVVVGKAPSEAVAENKPAASPEPAKAATAPATSGGPASAPAETAKQESHAAAPEAAKQEQQAEDESLASQPQPVVPDENAPPPPRPNPPVRIKAVEYKDTGPDTGTISLSGIGDPKIHVYLFFDQDPLGQVVIGDDGTWALDVDKKLPTGEHTIRADTFDSKTGMVAGRASVNIGREAETAQAGETPKAPEGETGKPEAAQPEAAETKGAQPETAKEEPAPAQPEAKAPQVAGQASESEPPAPPKPIRFKNVDYQDVGADSGKLTLSGTGEPGSRLVLMFDEEPLGQVAVTDTGEWAFEIEKRLGSGGHTIRANRFDPSTGIVIGSASISMGREPEAAAPETAAAEPAAPPPEVEPPASQPEVKQPEAAQTSATPPAEAAPPAPPAATITATEPGKATAATEPPVVFKSVDYADSGPQSGKVSLAGTAEPGAHLRLFYDAEPLGEVIVGGDGNWAFETPKHLEQGEHHFRADRVDQGSGVVIGSASVGIVRMEKPPEEPKQEQAAALAPPPAPAPAATSGTAQSSKPAPQVAVGEEGAKVPATAAISARRKHHRPRIYSVRRGDTLWEIAESYYGGGWHYRAIVQDNRRKIRNPSLIYPKQKFHIPKH
jgi:hypothetical protein